jgi:hypothetical protein
MSNSTTNLDLILTSQSQKELTANAMFDAASPSMLWGRRASQCGGLVFGYYGGALWGENAVYFPNGSITLPVSTTVYLEADPATGAVSQATGSFTPGKIPLYICVTSASAITSYTDCRTPSRPCHLSSLSVAGSADVTLNAAQASSQIVEFTGALTGNISVLFPARPFEYKVANLTSGAFTLTCKVAGQPGVAVGQGKRAILYANGTDICRAGPDV